MRFGFRKAVKMDPVNVNLAVGNWYEYWRNVAHAKWQVLQKPYIIRKARQKNGSQLQCCSRHQHQFKTIMLLLG